MVLPGWHPFTSPPPSTQLYMNAFEGATRHACVPETGTPGSPFWSAEVERAAVLRAQMPGVDRLQEQFVRYRGCRDAPTPNGWLLSESRAAQHATQLRHRACGSPPGSPPAPAAPPAPSPAPTTASAMAGSATAGSARGPRPGGVISSGAGAVPLQLPCQVQMQIARAPAEFCIPTKKDRMLKAHFQVQVKVVHHHNAPTVLPLRVRAFAVLRSALAARQADKWLPCDAGGGVVSGTASSRPRGPSGHVQGRGGAPQARHATALPCAGGRCTGRCRKGAVVPLKGRAVLPYRFLYTPPAVHVAALAGTNPAAAQHTPYSSLTEFVEHLDVGDLPPLDHAASAESWTGRCAHPWLAPSVHACSAAEPRGPSTCMAATPRVQTAPAPCPSHFRPQAEACEAAGGGCKGAKILALEAPTSMLPRASDPDHAEEVDVSVATGALTSNVSVAQFDFDMLEFLEPSRMAPLQMVFACIIGDGDLLYTVYRVPTIAICRPVQRRKAAATLSLPPTVYDDVRAQAEKLKAQLAAPSSASPPTSHATADCVQGMTPESSTHGVAAAAPRACATVVDRRAEGGHGRGWGRAGWPPVKRARLDEVTWELQQWLRGPAGPDVPTGGHMHVRHGGQQAAVQEMNGQSPSPAASTFKNPVPDVLMQTHVHGTGGDGSLDSDLDPFCLDECPKLDSLDFDQLLSEINFDLQQPFHDS